jgi:hypothetical protein
LGKLNKEINTCSKLSIQGALPLPNLRAHPDALSLNELKDILTSVGFLINF